MPVGRPGGGGAGAIILPASYATDFPSNENPISESGKWAHSGLDWTTPQTSGGLALCTQDGLGAPSSDVYNDSYAYLVKPFPADQRVDVVLHQTGSGITGNQEVECLLRWSDSAHVAQGYECVLSYTNNYGPQVVKWNGAYGDFTFVHDVAWGLVPQDGDVWSAQIVGTIVTVTLRRGGTIVNSGSADVTKDSGNNTIGVYSSGQPGMGLFRHNNGGTTNPSSYCVKSFAAMGL
jgi:hypothetical protein